MKTVCARLSGLELEIYPARKSEHEKTMGCKLVNSVPYYCELRPLYSKWYESPDLIILDVERAFVGSHREFFHRCKLIQDDD